MAKDPERTGVRLEPGPLASGLLPHRLCSWVRCRARVFVASPDLRPQLGNKVRIRGLTPFFCLLSTVMVTGNNKERVSLFEMLQISIHSSSGRLAPRANLVILVPACTASHTIDTQSWLKHQHQNLPVKTPRVHVNTPLTSSGQKLNSSGNVWSQAQLIGHFLFDLRENLLMQRAVADREDSKRAVSPHVTGQASISPGRCCL